MCVCVCVCVCVCFFSFLISILYVNVRNALIKKYLKKKKILTQMIFCWIPSMMEIRTGSSENNSVEYPLEFCKMIDLDISLSNSYVALE